MTYHADLATHYAAVRQRTWPTAPPAKPKTPVPVIYRSLAPDELPAAWLWLQPRRVGITVKAIRLAVAAHYGITLAELDSSARGDRLLIPRQVAIYLADRLTTASLPLIGELFHRDHSTILNSIRKVETDAGLTAQAGKIASTLKGTH